MHVICWKDITSQLVPTDNILPPGADLRFQLATISKLQRGRNTSLRSSGDICHGAGEVWCFYEMVFVPQGSGGISCVSPSL